MSEVPLWRVRGLGLASVRPHEREAFLDLSLKSRGRSVPPSRPLAPSPSLSLTHTSIFLPLSLTPSLPPFSEAFLDERETGYVEGVT